MKNYHVCVIGNALVDIEYYIDHAVLPELQIEKNVMTLIDETRQAQLATHLQAAENGRYCAGSAANSARTIAALGGRCFYSCKVANDVAGDFFVEDLRRLGVDSNLYQQERMAGTTGTCMVLVTPDAERTMNTHLGITQTFSMQEIHENAIAAAEFLYIEGYLAASPTASQAALLAKQLAVKHGTKVALTLSDHNMVKYFKEQLLALMQDSIELLFCNEAEAQLFCGVTNLQEICEHLQQFARTFVVTLGDRGALLFDGTQISHLPAHAVQVHDTVGAGDVFSGCFLYALTHGYGFEAAGRAANFAASRVIAQPGPRLGSNDLCDLQQQLASLKETASI